MSYADRQMETALTAMFQRKVTENRSTMRYWPAVTDRLGEQVSRRPWEYVMDAINRPRMLFKTQYIGGALVVVIAVLLLVLLLNTDDGADGESVPADSPQQIVPESGSGEPVGDTFDPDAEAETIRFRFDQKWEAYRLQDWDAYRAYCLPSQREKMSDDYLQNFYDAWLVDTVLTTEGFGTRISDVMVMSPIDSLVRYHTTEFSEPLPELRGILWTNVDGNWFSTVCTPWPI